MQQSLAELPSPGKAAYRLFYDAEAKKLLNDARGKDEAAKLTQIVDSYLITSVGDVAADRLGDLHFEQGNLDAAIRAWQSILAYRADSTIPRALTLTKVGIAMARSARWAEFRDILAQVRDRHNGESVEIGGRRVSAVAHLLGLAKGAGVDGGPSAAPQAMIVDFELPSTDEPLWQWRPFGRPDPEKPNTMLRMQNQWGQVVPIDMAIPTVSDGKRVYANLLGYHVAIDLETGKVLWRTGKYADLAQKLTQNQLVAPERFSLVMAGDRIWSVSSPIDNRGNRSNAYLTCIEAATGREILHSSKIGALQNWSFGGTPIVDGDRVYVAAFRTNPATELHMLALSASDGKVLWDTLVGNHKVDQYQNYYYRRSSQPSVLSRPGKLYIDTHAGALAELDTKTGRMNWGVVYESEVIDNNNGWNQPQKAYTTGAPLFAAGILYSKGMRSPRLLALRPEAPALAWKRPVAELSLVVGADDKCIYMSGDELTAYDLQTRTLSWSTKMPFGTGCIKPLLTENRIYQFSPRGVYEVNKADGQVRRVFRGADLDSTGGAVLLDQKTLLTSSNLAITAYPISRQSGHATQ